MDDPNPSNAPAIPEQLPNDNDRPFITVGSFSRPFRVANKIVRYVQDEGLWPRVLVCGHPSINQAVKGLANARRTLLQLGEPVDMGVLPRFRCDDHARPLLALDTVKLPLEGTVAAAAADAEPQQQPQQQQEDFEQQQRVHAPQQEQQQQHAAQDAERQPDLHQQQQHDPTAASTSQRQMQPQPQQHAQQPGQQHQPQQPPQQQRSGSSSSSSGTDVVGTQASPTSPLVIRVAAVGRHARAGAAAAARMREGANVHLTAVGVGAVGTAAMAAAHAAVSAW